MKVEIRELENGKKRKVLQLLRVDTKGKILSVEDTLGIRDTEDGPEFFNKVRWDYTEYSPGKPSTIFRHHMNIEDFLFVLWRIMLSQPIEYSEFKGSKSLDYSTGFESRQLTIKYNKELGYGKGGYQVFFKKGPGIEGDKGQVSPAKEGQFVEASMNMSAPDIASEFQLAYELTKIRLGKVLDWMDS